MTALAESFNGLYKTELIHRQGPWRNVEHVEWATLTYVDWFNNRRFHNEIGKIPPTEMETNYYRQIDTAELVSNNRVSMKSGPILVSFVRRLRPSIGFHNSRD